VRVPNEPQPPQGGFTASFATSMQPTPDGKNVAVLHIITPVLTVNVVLPSENTDLPVQLSAMLTECFAQVRRANTGLVIAKNIPQNGASS
jgi:hypothetical protein